MTRARGFTLIELIVAVGLFAMAMTLVSGAYLMMIGANRQVQGLASGINNLSFALETMARSIRTGVDYCAPGGCSYGGSTFSFVNEHGQTVTYSLSGSSIQETIGSAQYTLTNPSVTISSLKFYPLGTNPVSKGDYEQARVTISIAGTVAYGKGKTETFTIETGATMRTSDL